MGLCKKNSSVQRCEVDLLKKLNTWLSFQAMHDTICMENTYKCIKNIKNNKEDTLCQNRL